jgi:hypothetical protein
MKKFRKMTYQERVENSSKIIHLGLPMYLYDEEEITIIWGFWSFVTVLFPSINAGFDTYGQPGFYFLKYKGSYWKALYRFLKGDFNE